MPATSPVNNTQTPGGGWHRGTTNAASELLGAVDGIAAGHKDNKTAQKKLKKLEKKPKKKSADKILDSYTLGLRRANKTREVDLGPSERFHVISYE